MGISSTMCSGRLPEKARIGTAPMIGFLVRRLVRKAKLLVLSRGVTAWAEAREASVKDCLDCISLA